MDTNEELKDALAKVADMTDDEVNEMFNESVLPIPVSLFSAIKKMSKITVNEMMRAQCAAVVALEFYEAKRRAAAKPKKRGR